MNTEPETQAPKRKRKLRAWLIEIGVRTPFTCPKPTKLSKAGIWLREHPEFKGRILDMRAVLK
jgi:hypothetical protein